MGAAIGGALPLAVGIALSPVPIIAVVLMLTTRRARVNGPIFVAGWLAGLAVVGAIALSIAGPAGASSSGAPATWVSWVKLALGLLLLLVAARQFLGRPANGTQADLPSWMAKIDEIKPLPAACQTGISGGQQAIAYLVFALVGTIGVGAPVGIYFAMGARSEKPLAGLSAG